MFQLLYKSRVLVTTTIECCKQRQKAAVDALLFPLILRKEGLNTHICDVMTRVIKESTRRTLQQSFYHDWQRNWTVSVSWGYTVQIYPWFVLDSLLRNAFQTFQTWGSWKNEPFTFNTRPMSPDPCERPLMYFLDNGGSEVGGDSETLTSYKRFVAEPWNECTRTHFCSALALQTINVTASKMDVGMLSKAPQRQCCEITTPFNGVDHNSVIEIRIKSCSFEEGFSLPR